MIIAPRHADHAGDSGLPAAQPLSAQAYEQIRRKIVSLALPPGATVDEGALQEELGVGRTPIREALQRLSLEKLVTIVPRRGIFVTEIAITDLQRLFEVRIELETLGARLAAERGTPAHWRAMEDALNRVPQADDTPNDELIITDEVCHQILYEATDNKFLQDTLVTLYALSLRLWYFALAEVTDVRKALAEHREMLAALRAGDADRAEQVLAEHINNFQQEILAAMVGGSGLGARAAAGEPPLRETDTAHDAD